MGFWEQIGDCQNILANFPSQKGKEGQPPAEATLAVSVYRSEKFTLLPFPDCFVSLITNLNNKNNVCMSDVSHGRNLQFTGRLLLFGKVLGTTLSATSRSSCRKRSHQWCLTLAPNNTKTIERMICHCFLRPIRTDLTSSSYPIPRSSGKMKAVVFSTFYCVL